MGRLLHTTGKSSNSPGVKTSCFMPTQQAGAKLGQVQPLALAVQPQAAAGGREALAQQVCPQPAAFHAGDKSHCRRFCQRRAARRSSHANPARPTWRDHDARCALRVMHRTSHSRNSEIQLPAGAAKRCRRPKRAPASWAASSTCSMSSVMNGICGATLTPRARRAQPAQADGAESADWARRRAAPYGGPVPGQSVVMVTQTPPGGLPRPEGQKIQVALHAAGLGDERNGWRACCITSIRLRVSFSSRSTGW